MHRNTYLVVIFLAVFAALVVGVNVGRKLGSTGAPLNSTIASPSPAKSAEKLLTFTDSYCGFTIDYPETLTKLEDATGSAILMSPSDSKQAILLTCQKSIPRPAIPDNNIETVSIPGANGSATISAKLYHNTTAKDGTTIDQLIFRHPRIGLDVFIAGYGETFNKAIRSLKLL